MYLDDTGTTGNVTLSETAANFRIIEVFYFNNLSGINTHQSERIYNPDGRVITFASTGVVETIIQHSFASFKISGTAMTTYGEHYFNAKVNESTTVSGGISPASDRHNFIYCVVGYR